MQSSPNYEYKVFSQPKLTYEAVVLDDSQAKKIEDTLNKLGSEGWELAGITEAHYILKRPVK